MHPVREQRYLLHLSFGNIAGQSRAAGVGEKNIKKASVVAYIQNGFIRRNQFFANNSNFYTGQPQDKTKNRLDQMQRTDILCVGFEFTDDPFNDKNRN